MNKTFWDKAVDFPGFFMIEREIDRCLKGEKFFINVQTDDGIKSEHLPPVDFQAYIYYYTLWENYHFFGYPLGLDWSEDYDSWFNRHLKEFQNIHVAYENHRQEKEMKSLGK